jgi:hypothetical protein
VFRRRLHVASEAFVWDLGAREAQDIVNGRPESNRVRRWIWMREQSEQEIREGHKRKRNLVKLLAELDGGPRGR